MATPSGSEQLSPEHPFPFPGIQDYLLEGIAVYVGTLTAPAATGGQTTVQIIALGLYENKLLVALPQTAWHRVAARRLLAPDSIRKQVHAEVVAGSQEDPAQKHHAYKLKVWLGLLDDALVAGISYEEGDTPQCCFRGFGALAAVDMVPYGPALAMIAGEHFAFLTALEGKSESEGPREPPEEPEPSWEERLTGLEAGLLKVQKSLDTLVRAPAEGAKAAAADPKPGKTHRGAPGLAHEGLPGLDPTVVGAARQAGIPEEQLRAMSRLAMAGATGKPAKVAAAKPRCAKPSGRVRGRQGAGGS